MNQSAMLKTLPAKLIDKARRRAKAKNIDFDLRVGHIRNLLSAQRFRCGITGIPFRDDVPDGCDRSPWMPTLDRIDNYEGYVAGNVMLVCMVANYARNVWPAEVVRDMIRDAVLDNLPSLRQTGSASPLHGMRILK